MKTSCELTHSGHTEQRGRLERRNTMKTPCELRHNGNTDQPGRLERGSAMRIANGKFEIGRRKCAILCGLVLVLTLVSAGNSCGQSPPAKEEPVLVAPMLWKEDPLGQGVNLPTSCAPYQDENGPLLIGHPLLDGGATGMPGWVAGAEVGVVVPHVMNRLFDTVTRTSGASSTVQLPSAQIAAEVMPRFDLGYRFGQSTGELLLSYRFLTGSATDFASGNVVPAFGPSGANVTSRLNLNTWDLDYGSWEPLTVLGVNMKWRVRYPDAAGIQRFPGEQRHAVRVDLQFLLRCWAARRGGLSPPHRGDRAGLVWADRGSLYVGRARPKLQRDRRHGRRCGLRTRFQPPVFPGDLARGRGGRGLDAACVPQFPCDGRLYLRTFLGPGNVCDSQ